MTDDRTERLAPEQFSHTPVGDDCRKTTCYMCACRCGIRVHLREGRVRYIDGNPDHPINRGVLCAKGSAGIMQHYSPARLKKPLKRVGPRGSGEFVEIEWEEALQTAVDWLKPLRDTAPEKLAFFTGRDQSQSLTGWWAQQFGTPNFAAHGGFCSVNMAAAGIYTIGGAFWEFGQPDWEHSEYFMIFGVAEDHDSNPIKLGLSRLKERGVKVVGVNPVRSGYNAIADEWLGITPGSDGLLILSLVQCLLASGRVDLDYLLRYSNAPWLVIDDPGSADHGLIARNDQGDALVAERKTGELRSFREVSTGAALRGRFTLADGRSAQPVFELLIEQYIDERYAPEQVAERCGVAATTIRRIADELAEAAFSREVVIDQPWTDWRGEHHQQMIGRPVSFHAMRGISAHSNGFQTCRALHVLQIILGSVDSPGGFRYKPVYPKPAEAHPRPHGKATPGQPLDGPPLGYPLGPDDLLLDEQGQPLRIDKAYSWEAPFSAHGMMHMVIANASAGDPYRIDTLFLYMANMAWNSSMNSAGVIEMLTATDDDGEYRIPRIIYSDAYSSEMVHYADLILPDTTYLERHDGISLLDRPICEPEKFADAIRWPVVEPDRDVRCFQSVLLDLGARLELPGMVDDAGDPRYADYADYLVNHQRKPGIGPLAGWRGVDGQSSGRGEPNPEQLQRYIENGAFWSEEIPAEASYFKMANNAWQQLAVEKGLYDSPQPFVFQIYSEPLRRLQLAAEGHGDRQPPAHLKARIADHCRPLPFWYPPFEDGHDDQRFPLHAITQRPAAMYHSWGSQNAWLRQIHGENRLFVPASVCDQLGLKDDDWAWLKSRHAQICVPIRRMQAVNSQTLWTWNAIGKRRGAWQLADDAPESQRGFLLNHLISELLPAKDDGYRYANVDPITGQAAWFDLRVSIEKAQAPASLQPFFERLKMPLDKAPANVAWGEEWCQ
ncbi:molybdopterin oxidoreductase family protein [Gammaproteobacteria bacterium]|nr:molybdopterin oxidoreductase family protein [Gammaproteobacteria bacterium]